METSKLKDRGFAVHKWKDKRIADHCRRMSEPNQTILFDNRVAKVLESQGYEWVDDPRSIYDPEKLYLALAKYAPSEEPAVVFDQHVNAGIALAYKVFARPEDRSVLQPLTLTEEDIRAMTSNPSGSPGLSSFGVKKRDAVSIALSSALRIAHGDKVPEPCVCFKRTQFNSKTRLIWGYPYSMTALEGLLARPLIDEFKGRSSPMAFGLKTGVLGSRLRESAAWCDYAYSLDMSAFDSSISSKLIDVAFNIIATWFDLDASEPVSGVTYREIFHRVRAYFIRTPIVMPDQNVYVGKQHGVPSGSYFTQFVDSIVNVIFAGTISSKFNLDVSTDHLYVLGDDLLLWSSHVVSLDDISKYARKTLGLNVHGSEKSEITRYDEPVHFLGRTWEKGLPNASEPEILSRMLFPERFREYDSDIRKANAQVKRLVLVIAATYRDGWRIARRCYHQTDGRYLPPGFIERLPGDIDREQVDDFTMTGSQRFKLRYVFDQYDRRMRTTVAMQYWL